ncbi:hypothetical protein GWI34_43055, partial [Actinomadura sp. DSM 109109]|nr:hypothetical protein [Actinomadura lepetitiana]
MAIGLALPLQWVRERLAGQRPLQLGFDGLLIVGAAVSLVSAGPALEYPFPGKATASKRIESELGSRDIVLIPFRANWSFATESDFEADVEPWGRWLRYQYATFDFSSVREPGLYVIEYAGHATAPFRIAADVYRQGVWQPTL